MKKRMLETIFASEKRKSLLLLLKDGPQEMDDVLLSINTTRQALLPQIKILVEHYLIDYYDSTCRLTRIGELLVAKMTPLLGIIEPFDVGIDYWGTHKLDFIPPHFLGRLNELGTCTIIKPSISEVYEENNDFFEASKISQSLYGVTTFFHPNFAEYFSELISRNVNLYFIVTEDLLAKLKSDKPMILKNLMDNSLMHFYVYNKEMKCASFSYNDHYMKMRPLTQCGNFDTKYVLCSSPSALKWGKELFDYYLKDSLPVTEI
jgi:predicted transcriptional regulator